MEFRRRMLISFSVVSAVSGQGPRPRSGSREEDEWAWVFDWLSRPKKSEQPKKGFVPDEMTAAAIGEAVARGLYGESAVRERPFRARLRGGVWTVMGTLNPPGRLGGVAIVQIGKTDGRILFVAHTA